MAAPTHQSDSSEQRAAEALVLAGVEAKLGLALDQGVRLQLGDAWAEVDGASADRSVLVEVFARIGHLKGAQLHKVSTDILKLLTLGRERPDATLILAFASEAAAASIVGWRQEVLKASAIETLIVELDEAVHEELERAQARQRMVNAP